MNLSLLRYRIQIGGAPWIVKTGLGVARAVMPSARTGGAPFDLGSQSPDALRILYIHSGWAIETVGKLWFTEQNLARVTFVCAGDAVLTDVFIRQFDFVWYGYWALYHQHPSAPDRAIVAIHDPSELFTQKPDWKSDFRLSSKWISHFLSLRRVVVISKEMEDAMAKLEIPTKRIPTTSNVPIRQTTNIPIDVKPKVLGVGRIYPRKNFECFKEVSRIAESMGIITQFRLKCDHYPVLEAEYLAMLDEHPIYLCTSYQEGGPLPVMDAMRRGAVVISTPVGQIPEIIEHGINGFICHTKNEMLEVIQSLESNLANLHQMRVRSVETIVKKRDPAIINRAVCEVLNDLVAELQREIK